MILGRRVVQDRPIGIIQRSPLTGYAVFVGRRGKDVGPPRFQGPFNFPQDVARLVHVFHHIKRHDQIEALIQEGLHFEIFVAEAIHDHPQRLAREVVRSHVRLALPFQLQRGSPWMRRRLVNSEVAPIRKTSPQNECQRSLARNRSASRAKQMIAIPVMLRSELNVGLADRAVPRGVVDELWCCCYRHCGPGPDRTGFSLHARWRFCPAVQRSDPPGRRQVCVDIVDVLRIGKTVLKPIRLKEMSKPVV